MLKDELFWGLKFQDKDDRGPHQNDPARRLTQPDIISPGASAI